MGQLQMTEFNPQPGTGNPSDRGSGNNPNNQQDTTVIGGGGGGTGA